MTFIFYLLIIWNFVAIVLNLYDKIASIYRWRRIPEKTLLLIAVFGGGLGSIFAQQIFRHKSNKALFNFVYCIGFVISVFIIYYLVKTIGDYQ